MNYMLYFLTNYLIDIIIGRIFFSSSMILKKNKKRYFEFRKKNLELKYKKYLCYSL